MGLSDIMHLRASFCEKYVGGELTPSPPVFFFEKYSKIVNFLGNFAQILYSTQCKRCCPQTCIFQKEACKRINSPLKDRKIPPKCVRVCVFEKICIPSTPSSMDAKLCIQLWDSIAYWTQRPSVVIAQHPIEWNLEINLSTFTTRVVNAFAHLFLENINLVMRASSTLHPV